LLKAALKKKAALKASGYNQLQTIKVSKPQGSGKALYINKKNEPKSFQIGQLLMREKVQWKKKDSAVEYFKHLAVENLHEEFVPYIQAYFDEIACILHAHAKHFMDEALQDGLAVSSDWCHTVASAYFASMSDIFLLFCGRSQSRPLPLIVFQILSPPSRSTYFLLTFLLGLASIPILQCILMI
jgi:hypothetical protein